MRRGTQIHQHYKDGTDRYMWESRRWSLEDQDVWHVGEYRRRGRD